MTKEGYSESEYAGLIWAYFHGIPTDTRNEGQLILFPHQPWRNASAILFFICGLHSL